MPEPYGMPPGAAINYNALGFPAWVDEMCRQWNLDSSTYPGHQEGDRPDIGAAPNPQHLNRGIDWAGDPQRMLEFAHWLVSIGPDRKPGQYGPPGLEMVIYQDPRTGERVWYPSWVDYSSDFGGHTDHVHTRQSASLIDYTTPAVRVMTVPLTQNANDTWTSPSPAWAHLINRESGGNPTIIQQIIDVNSGGNEAEGLFQITPRTWRAHGGDEFAASPRLASPQQQAIVAARIFTANPSGSDWGAGLPGRENANELAAGLVPISDTPAPPHPQEDDDMPDWFRREDWEWVFNELHKQFPSRDMYRTGDEPTDTLAGKVLDGVTFGWEDRVESSARRGEQWAIDLVEKAAAGQLAGVLKDDGTPNEFLVNHAQAVLDEIRSVPATPIIPTSTQPPQTSPPPVTYDSGVPPYVVTVGSGGAGGGTTGGGGMVSTPPVPVDPNVGSLSQTLADATAKASAALRDAAQDIQSIINRIGG